MRDNALHYFTEAKEVVMPRDNAMTIRLSDEERKALAEAAKSEDVPASIIVRRAVKRELERLSIEAKKGPRP